MKVFISIAVGLVLILCPYPAEAAADHLVISQVQITGGAGQTTNDFVEIYNPTNADIDLNGIRLVKRTNTGTSSTSDTSLKSWTSSAIVPAHGYYLWANSSFTTIAVTPNATTTGSIADNNGVALRQGANDTGTIIDSAAWGTAANAFVEGTVFGTNPAAGQSLERKPGSGAGNGDDTNNNSADFFLQTTAHPRNSASAVEPAVSPAPAPAPSPSPAPASSTASGGFALEVSEIMPNPKGKDQGSEWVEFFNSGSGQFNLSGWMIDDDLDQDIPSKNALILDDSSIVPPFGYLTVTIPKGKFALNNADPDAVCLFDENKNLRLRAGYTGPAKEGHAYARDSMNQWAWTEKSSPGAANVFAQETFYASNLIISEAVPNPAGDDGEGEYIEIHNFGADSVDLADWVVSDKTKRYIISEDDFDSTELAAGEYFVLYREVTGINLNNSGEEEVKLFNPTGELVNSISISGTKEAESYSWASKNVYQWTIALTPGEKNKFYFTPQQETPAKKAAEKEVPISETKRVELKNIRHAKIGELLTTSGVVSATAGVFGENIIYLHGSGIRVVFNDPLIPAGLKIGDLIELSGILKESRSEMQLFVSTNELKVLESGQKALPYEIKTGEVGEPYEGSLVQIAGEVSETSGDTFYVDDGSGPARVLIQESTGIEKPRMKKGEFVTVTGIISSFNDIYRVLPRMQTDLVFGRVAGATELPRTGMNFWLILAVLSAICYTFKVNIKFALTHRSTGSPLSRAGRG